MTSTVAKVYGEVWDELPDDLYIPPEYLEILLESFEGPLDLLLYLIRKKNFDLLNIPIKDITKQYLTYLHLMKQTNRDVAIEYLVMAGTLVELKSRLLLPRSSDPEEQEEEDPRLALARRLMAYEQCQKQAQFLDDCELQERDFLSFTLDFDKDQQKQIYHCCLQELKQAYVKIIQRQQHVSAHTIVAETLSVQEAMLDVLEQLQNGPIAFRSILAALESKSNLIIYFLSVLELAKEMVIVIEQDCNYGSVMIQRRGEEGHE